MDAGTEFKFLTELRYLADAGLGHGDRIRAIMQEWSAANETANRYVRLPPEQARARELTNQWHASMQALQMLQRDLFVTTDALLGICGRIALILRPHREDTVPVRKERGERLRTILGIDRSHPVLDRTLRNKWLHYDEVLDEIGASYVHAQRFIESGALKERDRQNTLRLYVVDEMRIVYAGVGEFRLAEQFELLADLERRVAAGIASWAGRWRDDSDDDADPQ